MEEHQNVSLSTGPSELNRSYYTGNSLSALQSSQQFTTSSGSALGSQLLHCLISSQVPAGPARNVTGEVMPTSLAEALTQLSFLEFLQRCDLLIAPHQPPQLPVPICFHTTTAHGVLYWMCLLGRSSGPPKPRSSVPAISTRSTCLAAAAARTRTARLAS